MLYKISPLRSPCQRFIYYLIIGMNWCICNLLFFYGLKSMTNLWSNILFHSTQSLVCSILLNTCFPATKEKLKIFFRNKFPGLFQYSDWFFQHLKIHINPFTLKIAILILLTVCHTLNVFYFSSKDFQNFQGPVAFFQDFPVLKNATIKFQDFPGFPWPVNTKYC